MQATRNSPQIIPQKQGKKSALNPDLQRKIGSLAIALLDMRCPRSVVERRIDVVLKEAARGR